MQLLKPAFTILVDRETKCFLLLIRGTHSIKDTLTAATGAVVPFHHSVLDEGGVKKLVLGYAHCGMVAAARWIAKCTTPFLLKAVSQHPNYKIKVPFPLFSYFQSFTVLHILTCLLCLLILVWQVSFSSLVFVRPSSICTNRQPHLFSLLDSIISSFLGQAVIMVVLFILLSKIVYLLISLPPIFRLKPV